MKKQIVMNLLGILFCLGVPVAFAAAETLPKQTIATNEIRSANVAQIAGNAVLRLEMKEPLTAPPPSFSIANPARIVIDIPGVRNGIGKSSQAINEGVLRSINLVEVETKTRLVLNLNQLATSDMQIEGNALLIRLAPSTPPDKQLNAVTHFSAARPSEKSYAIRDLSFRRGKDGEARLLVDLADPNAGIDIRQQGSQLIVEFAKTQLPEHLRKRLDVTDFATPVTTVLASQQGDMARLTITPKGLWEHNAYQSENQFVVEVKPVIENPNKLVQGSRGGYQGEKLSLNFQNVDVRRLLQVIGEFTGMNMVVSDTVSGNLTLILKDVPWDQALDIILQQRGLDMRKNGNVILVAPRDEIATKEKLEFESRKQIGDLEPLKSESFQLNYHKAKTVFDFLKDKDQTVLSQRGSVIVDERSNKLFINDTPSRIDDLRRLIAEIDIPVRQVLIEARIVEASDSFSKDLGVRLGWLQTSDNDGAYRIGNKGPVRGNLVGGATAVGTGKAVRVTEGKIDQLPEGTNVNLPASPRSGQAGSIAFVLFNSARTQFLNLEVSALEADGRGKVVSSPRVVTADKVEALIEQGVEIPYQQATSSGATSVSFRKANLALKVTPQITPDGKVTMTLDINKDTPNTRLSTGGAGVAIDTKHVKTEVLVENGGTVVIGGIYQQELRETSNRIPVLGEIPYLGWLFKNTSKQDDKSELLVFITPKIISESMNIK